MKACNACHVKVQSQSDFCPLCGTPLEPAAGSAEVMEANRYPDLSGARIQYNFIWRLLVFLTLLVCGVSVLVNFLVTPGALWSLIVLGAALYCWLAIPPLLRRGVNFAAQVVLQVILTSGIVIGLDFFFGYKGWSTTFVVPSLLIAGIVSIALMAVLNRTNWAQYVLYQGIMALFGFIPLALYLFGIANNLVMVLVTAGLALASLLATIVFGDRSIKSEFKRRFHL